MISVKKCIKLQDFTVVFFLCLQIPKIWEKIINSVDDSVLSFISDANILDQHSRDSLNLSSESASQIKASTEVMKTGFQQMTMELKKSLAK